MKNIIIVAAVLAGVGCAKETAAPAVAEKAVRANTTQKQPTLPEGHPQVAGQPAGAGTGESKQITGKVAESLDAAGFTYVRLDTPQGRAWFVLSPVEVKKGEKLTVQPNMTMDNFESKSLKRTFDRVTFATIVNGGTPARAAEFPPAMMAALAKQGGGPAPEPAKTVQAPVKVEKPEGGKSVAELWASRASLADSNVVVRGKVVKSLSGIMGKNWIHLQDGSGSASAGDNDLTVTTAESIKAGEVVTIRGVVRVDKDFGAGYKYPVLVEDARVVR